MMSALAKPILFIDFDRTLFDTERFYAWLGSDRHAQILELLSGRRAHPDYHEFLFPGADDFLHTMRERYRIVLLSYSVNVTLQRRKIRDSGVASRCDDVLIVQCDKGTAVTEYLSRFQPSAWTHIFVDDQTQNILDVKNAHEEMRVIQVIARDALDDPKHTHGADLAVRDLRALAEALVSLR